MNKVVWFVLFFFFVGVFLVVGVCSVEALPLVEDSWSSGASMSQARSGLGVVAVDGKIYAIGGTTNGRSDKLVVLLRCMILCLIVGLLWLLCLRLGVILL